MISATSLREWYQKATKELFKPTVQTTALHISKSNTALIRGLISEHT